MDGSESESVLSSLQEPLRAIGSVVLPSPDALDDEGWAAAESIIEGAMAAKPTSVKLQLRLFLKTVNLLPLVTTGRTLGTLPFEKRKAFVERLHRSPLMPLRRGLWGIRTLLFMGYYNQERVRTAIGYNADPRGWTAHVRGELRDEPTEDLDEAGGVLGEGGAS
jgi:hypothetical protein